MNKKSCYEYIYEAVEYFIKENIEYIDIDMNYAFYTEYGKYDLNKKSDVLLLLSRDKTFCYTILLTLMSAYNYNNIFIENEDTYAILNINSNIIKVYEDNGIIKSKYIEEIK